MFDFDSKFSRPQMTRTISNSLIEELINSWDANLKIYNITELSGGYSNFNFKVESDKGKFVCRVSHKQNNHLQIEREISKLLFDKTITPYIHYVGNKDDIFFAIVDFVEGNLLSEIWRDIDSLVLEEILIDLGEKLRLVHGHHFKDAGFFAPNLNVVEKFSMGVGTGYFDFINSSLKSELVLKRMERDFLRDITHFVYEKKYKFKSVNVHRSLVHSDFNTKNILVSIEERKVNAILDWEFAHSGTPLCDFANFLRFEEEIDFNVSELLQKGYGNFSKAFGHDWREICYLLDLASMFGFLIRGEASELTLNTAKKIIQETIY